MHAGPGTPHSPPPSPITSHPLAHTHTHELEHVWAQASAHCHFILFFFYISKCALFDSRKLFQTIDGRAFSILTDSTASWYNFSVPTIPIQRHFRFAFVSLRWMCVVASYIIKKGISLRSIRNLAAKRGERECTAATNEMEKNCQPANCNVAKIVIWFYFGVQNRISFLFSLSHRFKTVQIVHTNENSKRNALYIVNVRALSSCINGSISNDTCSVPIRFICSGMCQCWLMLMLYNRFSYIENAVDNGSPNRNKKNVAEFYGECQLDFSLFVFTCKTFKCFN